MYEKGHIISERVNENKKMSSDLENGTWNEFEKQISLKYQFELYILVCPVLLRGTPFLEKVDSYLIWVTMIWRFWVNYFDVFAFALLFLRNKT
jgi:hypothetical protein